MKRTYGWRKQPKDERDILFSVAAPLNLPRKIDLSDKLPPCYDQGRLSSCTANAIAAAIQYDEIGQKGISPDHSPVPSRLFIYYNERLAEGSEADDNGAIIRDGVKSANLQGFCPEDLWAYDPDKVNVAPPHIAYSVATLHLIKIYKALHQSASDLRGCLAQGYPFIFGFTVYPSIDETETTGILQMPSSDDAPEGGHAVLCCGYDDDTKMFLIRNSWGTEWGNSGYFWMPYAYMLNPNLASDFWCINTI